MSSPGIRRAGRTHAALSLTETAMFRPTLSLRHANLRELADEDLMALVQEGEARALEVIFDRNGGPAFSLAYRMCGRREMAEDIVQEAFVSVWRSGARYGRARGSVRSWVLSAVHNRAIDALRREHVRERRTPGCIECATAPLPCRRCAQASVIATCWRLVRA